MPNIIQVPHNLTKDQAAKLLGLKTYDTALPQPWLDFAAETLAPMTVKDSPSAYDMLVTSIVWSYDQAKIFGAPHPLTLKAWGLLKVLDMETGSHCVDEIDSLMNVLDIG